MTFAQIVALDTILNEIETLEFQTRRRNPCKCVASSFVPLSESESSIREGPVYFRLKHPFKIQSGFVVDAGLINQFTKWLYKNATSRLDRSVLFVWFNKFLTMFLFQKKLLIFQFCLQRGRKSTYIVANDKMEHEMDFGILKVNKKDWFHIIVHAGRPWEDEVCLLCMYIVGMLFMLSY